VNKASPTAPEPRFGEQRVPGQGRDIDITQIFDDDLIELIQTPVTDAEIHLRSESAKVRRRQHAKKLVTVAAGRRPLEALRSMFIRRLHRASDDFAATEGLRAVEAALALVPWSEPPTAPGRPKRQRRAWFLRRARA
jgi:hypothetical protein